MSFRRGYIITWLVLLQAASMAQESDTSKQKARPNVLTNIFNQYIESITIDPPDPEPNQVLNTRSEDIFLPYEGKIIRNIEIRHFGFEKTFQDTASRINYIGTRILNALHNDTKPWVIRNNLFFKRNTALNAYRMADNERHLRQLTFVQDARILVIPLPGNPDSVDIEIITKDFFTITASATAIKFDKLRARIKDENLGGMGQRVQLTALFHYERDPKAGYELNYSKNNVAGSFVNASLNYSLISSSATGRQEEENFSLGLDKPLISPYSKLAWSGSFRKNISHNRYGMAEEQFLYYRGEHIDIYLGYNLDAKKQFQTKATRRHRRFLAARHYRSWYPLVPYQEQGRLSGFSGNQTYLAQFTFFHSDFFKMQYIYGFGATEDLPYGYNTSLIAGWQKQLQYDRPYAGADINRYIINKTSDFIQVFARAGTFYYKGNIQDAALLVGGTVFSRIMFFCNWKWRQYARISYTEVFRPLTSEILYITNPFGIRDFNYSPVGRRRINLSTESFVFLNGKWLGFRFSPFVFADLAMLTPEHRRLESSQLWTSLGAGLRTRNENLIFGTIELRMFWFPREVPGKNEFKVALRSNIRFRYRHTYVNAPAFIQLNSE